MKVTLKQNAIKKKTVKAGRVDLYCQNCISDQYHVDHMTVSKLPAFRIISDLPSATNYLDSGQTSDQTLQGNPDAHNIIFHSETRDRMAVTVKALPNHFCFS